LEDPVFVLGLLLLAAGGAVAVAVALHNTDAATLTAFGSSYDTTVLGVFLLGGACGLAVMLGLSLMAASARRRRVRRRTVRGQLKDVRTENERLAHENAELRAAMADNQTVDAGDPYPAETSTSRHSVR
jgi:membrane protein implicated in regulation of membrane protease activity